MHVSGDKNAPVVVTAGANILQRSFAVGNLSTEWKKKEAEK
jgi:hypothetical protein